MDEFKKYINQRAEELDIDVPLEKVWQAIKQDLQPAKRNATLVYMKWAVAACVIVLAGFGLYKLQDNNRLQVTSYQLPVIKNQEPRIKSQEPSIKSQEPATNNEELIAKVEVPGTKFQGSNKPQTINSNPKIQNKQQTTNNKQQTTGIATLNQIENTFTQIINLQKAKVNTTPLNAESPGYFNDFTIEMKRMESDEQTLKKEIAKTGLTDELLDQLINVYQQKLNMLKQLQNEIHKTNNRFKQNRGPVDSTKTYFLNI